MSKALATKNVAAALIGVGLVLSFAFVSTAKADTISDLQAQVQALLAQIQALQGGSSMSMSAGAGCHTFTRDQKMGDSGGEVMWIQQFLNGHGSQVAASGAGSPGNESSHFGAKTQAAVKAFQKANSISPMAGYWGPKTRASANAMCASSSTGGGTTTGGTTVPTGPGVTVTAGAQPANSLAPGGAARVPFTTFTLTNNTSAAVTINGVTVQRSGLAQDQVFTGLALVDSNGLQIGISKTLNSNHQATVGGTWTLGPGQSQTLTVVGNMQSAATLASYAGQVVSVSLVGVNTSVPVNGVLPITGAQQTVNATLTLGGISTSTSSYDPGAAQTRNIGDAAVRFTGIKFTASSAEDVKLYSVRWRQTGSVSGATDLANLVTIVNGTSYPTSVDSTGQYFTTVFPGGLLITKGNSVDVYIQGDISGSNASGRTAEFDIDKVTDVYFVGQTYGYGIAPSGTATPWFSGHLATINPGTATSISKANEVAAQNVAANVNNQILGGFATNFTGESVSVQGMVFQVATSTGSFGGATNVLTSVSIVDSNGAVVAGPVDATAVGGNLSETLTFSDTVTFPVGRHVYTLKGKIPSAASNGTSLYLTTTPSTNWSNAQGQVSGSTITLPSTQVQMNTMTVQAGSLFVTMSAQPAAQNIVAGVQGFVFANLQLDASQSGEDVRVASLPIIFAGDSENLTGCQLWDGATALNTGSRVVNNPTGGSAKSVYSLDNTLTIGKGTVKTLGIGCNLSSQATSSTTYRFGVDTTQSDYSVTGATSGNNITPTNNGGTTISASNGGLMTVQTGSLAVTVDPSSPSYAVAAGGTNGVVVGVYKLRASNEGVNLTKLGLTLANGTTTAYNDLGTVWLYNGSTLIGSAQFTGSNQTATSTLTTPLSIPKDTDVLVTAKADLADISSSGSAVSGDLVKVDPLNAEGSGASSGGTVRVGATSGVAGVRIFNTYPTLAQDTLPSTGVADGRLLRFKVTANSMGNVGIYQVKFTVSTSSLVTGSSASNFSLWGFSDSAYSQGISGQSNGGQIDSTIATTTCVGVTSTANGSGCTFSSGIATLTFKTSGASPVEVPAGGTYYFELRSTVGGVQTGSSVVTTMSGDTNFSGAAAALLAASSVTGNFVWSDNATTTTVAAVADWANGYGLNGLSSSGIIQTRSN